MELFAQIRRDARVEGLGIRALARKYKVGRDTVRHALANPEPPRRKTPVRESPKLGPLKPAIDAMLRTDLDAPRKQRHTATRICNRLADEHGVEDVSYSSVRDYVRVRRAEIIAESGKQAQEAFVPQEHPPGAEAEVDFGEVHVILAGVRTRCYMFVFRMSMSGKAVHRVYATQSQEAFLEGHIEAFDVIGGIPVRHIRYDNLKSAVTSVVFGRGRGRVENDRWVLFRSFYGFDPFYCQPGVKGAHEKGGVEGEIGRFRRTWLTPMPEVDSLSELNDYIRRCEAREDHRRVTGRLHTVGQDFQTEREHLAALPAERFDPGLVLHPRVDRSALITARSAKYSVPARLIGRKVRVSLRASELVVFDGRTIAARHERVTTRNGQSINLDHYLEVLHCKPGALPGSTALAQARAAGTFTAAHEAFWQQARRVDGDAGGTRSLIDVLLLHRSMRATDVIAGIHAALSVGAVSADVVAVEARLHAAGGGLESDRHAGNHANTVDYRVVSLTQRRLADPATVIAGLPPTPGRCLTSRPTTSCSNADPQHRHPVTEWKERLDHEHGHESHQHPAPPTRDDPTSGPSRRRFRMPTPAVADRACGDRRSSESRRA
ncbi:transposase (plasmid) [Mycobacterium sp. 20KCMC460]|nr:transposase [Mycobacterium sp. 20KCMC460]BDE17307.1 transposase [Mycobacterium sp. 20KCMC460]